MTEFEKKEFNKTEDVFFKNARYSECSFKGITPGQRVFSDISFVDCTFFKCDFANTLFINCYVKAVKFSHCKLMGIDWSGFNYSAFFNENLSFDECILDYGCFIGLKARKLTMKNCMCKEADFENADLQKSNFFGTDFAGSRFVNTDLQEASFLNAKNYSINPVVNKIKKGVFSLPDVYNLLDCLDIIIRPRIDGELK